MPAGILRKTYECSLDTYPLGDVRGRQAIIQDFIADLVDLDIGWVIVSENIPASNFTSTSTYYRCWLRYKNSDHLLQVWAQGGTSSYASIQFSLHKSGSTTETVANSGNMEISNATYGHRMLVIFYYSADWCCARFRGATFQDWPSPAETSNVGGFSAFAVESFIDSQVTSEYLSLNGSGIFTGNGQYGYLTGSDASLEIEPVKCHSDMASGIEKIQKAQIRNNVWLLKVVYNFSNKIGAAVHSILVINSINYFYFNSYGGNYPMLVRLG